jgi:hypothetical protein
MVKDSRGNQWISSDQAVLLFNAIERLEGLHDFHGANETMYAAWEKIEDVMEDIRNS